MAPNQDLKNDKRTTCGFKNIELTPSLLLGATVTVLVNNHHKQHLQAIKGSAAIEEIHLCAIKGYDHIT